MSVPLSEQETTIGWYRDSNECFVYTSDSTVMTKLDKLVAKSDKWTLDEVMRQADTHEVVGKTYKTNKKLISFRADTLHRTMSEEQKEVNRQRLKAANEQRTRNQK